MSLHHKLCHVLGGAFDLPHAETHAVVLPYVLAYNAAAAPAAVAALGEALHTDDPVRGLWEFTGGLGVPRSLRALGMTEVDVDRAVALTVQEPYANPVPVTADRIRALLTAALDGRAPQRRLG
jgi:maleylacetate reductase